MRLSYVIELVMAVAAGLALERTTIHIHRDIIHEINTYPTLIRYGVYLIEFGDPLFVFGPGGRCGRLDGNWPPEDVPSLGIRSANMVRLILRRHPDIA